MRRAVLVVVVGVVLVGTALIVLGRGDGRRAGVDHPVPVTRRNHPATTSSVLLPEGTWTFGSGPSGFAAGRMHITGGPKTPQGTMPDSPLRGFVEVHHAGDAAVLEPVEVDSAGRFRLDLPVGDYELIGHSPNVSGVPIESQIFSITAGRTTPVDLVVQAT